MKKAIPLAQTTIVISALVASTAGFSDTSKASDENMPTIEQHAPHEHGAANLTIAIDANMMEINMESPADNIFGFEYVPSSDEDKKTVKDAVTKLKAANTLFSIPDAAKCHLDQVNVSSAMLEKKHMEADNKKHDDEHEHADKDHDKHGDKHADKDHDEHKGEHHDEDGDEHHHAHNDVDVSWHYTCQATDKLDSITPHFFTVFAPRFKHLKVEWLTSAGASSEMITSDKRINFKTGTK